MPPSLHQLTATAAGSARGLVSCNRRWTLSRTLYLFTDAGLIAAL